MKVIFPLLSLPSVASYCMRSVRMALIPLFFCVFLQPDPWSRLLLYSKSRAHASGSLIKQKSMNKLCKKLQMYLKLFIPFCHRHTFIQQLKDCCVFPVGCQWWIFQVPRQQSSQWTYSRLHIISVCCVVEYVCSTILSGPVKSFKLI